MGNLHFLDILLTWEEDGSNTVYRKATHTNQYHEFPVPPSSGAQEGCCQDTAAQSDALLSSGVSQTEETKHVTKALQRNGCSKGFTYKHTRYQAAVRGMTPPYSSGLLDCLKDIWSQSTTARCGLQHPTLCQALIHKLGRQASPWTISCMHHEHHCTLRNSQRCGSLNNC